MQLTVHRGAHQIGGTCIELVHSSGARLILDAGRPLDAPKGATGLLPGSLDRSGQADVLICHAHQDHWGLISELPPGWPVWTGASTAKLIEITARAARQPLGREMQIWPARQAFEIGPFRITPILTDHSAFDAYMLLIEGDGRRIFYSGDFRRHGRKSKLVDWQMANPPPDIDLLILEGTNLGTDKPVMTEAALEADFVRLMENTPGRIFVTWSAQNIDRTVTLFRAAKRTGRDLVVDLYAAEVLDIIAGGTRIPRPGWDNVKVVITRNMKRAYDEALVARMAKLRGIGAARLAAGRNVIMLRDSLVDDFAAKEVMPTPQDAFVWSMWRGYWNPESKVARWMADAGLEPKFMHTSGHASPADLRAFASAIAPGRIVPVHGENWNSEVEGFENLHPVLDGEKLTV